MTTRDWNEYRKNCINYYENVYEVTPEVVIRGRKYRSTKSTKRSEHLCQPQYGDSMVCKSCEKRRCPHLKMRDAGAAAQALLNLNEKDN